MLAPSIEKNKIIIHAKHTIESRRKIKASFALLYQQEHSLTLDMCMDHCTVAGL